MTGIKRDPPPPAPDLTTPGAAKRGLEMMLHLVPRTQEREPFLRWRIKWAFFHLAKILGGGAALDLAESIAAHYRKEAAVDQS
jgi:hypothetical protein